jgi:hypothetical protein
LSNFKRFYNILFSVFTVQILLAVAELSFFAIHLWILSDYLPDVLQPYPATGGDTGSHLWPVVLYREYGIPHLDLRPWNPGNYLGEPLLVHYFQLPFIAMAFLSYFMPVGLAFNIGTFLPIVLLAPAAWWGVRRFSLSFAASTFESRVAGIAAAYFSYGVLFNDGNTMWGGNFFSLLAGQFAHQYAFVFFFLFLGALSNAIRHKGSWITAGVFFALIVMCHAYVALFLPLVFLGFLFLNDSGTMQDRFIMLFKIGAVGVSLSLWAGLPLVNNSKWTTPYGFVWQFQDWIKEALPETVSVSVLVTCGSTILATFSRMFGRVAWPVVLFWGAHMVAGVIGYKYFDKIGLVDVRTIPHIHYSMAALAALLLAFCIGRGNWLLRAVGIVLFAGLPYWQLNLIKDERKQLQGWVDWNYSSWVSKQAYTSLQAVANTLNGTFNDDRVAFEHDGSSNIAGTPRVFEMLPYFAGRAVTDGLYMQSTILAPMSFYHQATLSKSPSCPFPGYPCSKLDLERGIVIGRLLNIGNYILSSELAFAAVEKVPDLDLELSTPHWKVYRDKQAPRSYAFVPPLIPGPLTTDNWRTEFLDWYTAYEPNVRFVGPEFEKTNTPDSERAQAAAASSCRPAVEMDYSKMTLKTECPRVWHIVKVAFHGAWKAMNGDALRLVSPGFIAIKPSEQSVELTFGRTLSWRFATFVYFATMLALMAHKFRSLLKELRRPRTI